MIKKCIRTCIQKASVKSRQNIFLTLPVVTKKVAKKAAPKKKVAKKAAKKTAAKKKPAKKAKKAACKRKGKK